MGDANRSWLFIPGSSEKMLGKAPALEADAVILDLEDAVAPHLKSEARRLCSEAVSAGGIRAQVFVRINPLETSMGREDLSALVRPGLTGIVLPKAENRAQIEALDAVLREEEKRAGLEPGSIEVAPLVETPRGVLNAASLARAARVCALCLGGEDLSLALGARRTPEGRELDFARGMLVTAAAAAGKQAVDTVWTDVRDTDGLARECRQMRDLGYTGKLAIHPAQIVAIHEAFSPKQEEIAQARRVVETFEAAGSGVVSLDGKMLDAPVVERARRLVARAERDGSSALQGGPRPSGSQR
ncbi:MAG: CoA ester lyase [Actinobacteria bacterium]|nr:CoA ester lyase [Actinomycetota bacterium]